MNDKPYMIENRQVSPAYNDRPTALRKMQIEPGLTEMTFVNWLDFNPTEL